MGARRIFSRQGPKVDFPGVGVKGVKVCPNCFDLLKSGQKWRPAFFDFKKWCPTFAEKHMNPFLEVTPKQGRIQLVSLGRRFQ